MSKHMQPETMPSTSLTEADIATLVTTFYDRVRQDAVLGPIFDGAIEDWPHHLEKLQSFWSSVILTSGRYKGQPMAAHFRHARHMTAANFARWLDLWRETTAQLLPPATAAVFQEKADRIAESLQLGVRYWQEQSAT